MRGTKTNMPFLPNFNDADDQFALEPTDMREEDSSQNPDHRVRVAIRALRKMQQQLENVLDMLERGEGMARIDAGLFRDSGNGVEDANDDRVVEGVFDGERMMGTDGIKYNVPPNYASKSKLLEGDILKLVIKEDGSFIFKQIGPVDRDRIVGTLVMDDIGNFAMTTDDGKTYRILTASVTYFKGEAGDEVAALVPKWQSASWAAVENIIKTGT
ncbi:MAG: hypothetical protein AAB570_00310 [Patescibacteria group bacterium]